MSSLLFYRGTNMLELHLMGILLLGNYQDLFASIFGKRGVTEDSLLEVVVGGR